MVWNVPLARLYVRDAGELVSTLLYKATVCFAIGLRFAYE